MMDLIKEYASKKSILGICLGHQAIAEAFDAELENMEVVLHGFGYKTKVEDQEEILFDNVPSDFVAARYHSWVVKPETINKDLKVTALSEDNRIMGIRHTKYDVRGLQFHPESVLTTYKEKMIGKSVIENWLKN